MKILYIVTQGDGGGAQKYTLALARHFGGFIAAGTEQDRLFDEARGAGLEAFPLRHLKREINPIDDLLAAWEIRGLIKHLRPDIVHLNSSKAGILGSFAAIGLKTKVVFTAHGFIFNEPMNFAAKNFYLALEKTASDFRDFIICVSEADKRSALKGRLIDPKKVATVHNGLPALEFLAKDEARAQLRLPQHIFVFGTIANFYKTKGLDVLINAASKLDKKILDKCLFVLVGDGPEFKNCKLKIKKLGLQNSLLTPGSIAKANIYLKAFDAFILPSRKEGFSYTLLEAMQAGLPIIATNVGGNAEALGDAAIMVEAENPPTLSQSIIKMATENVLRQRLSEKASQQSKLFTEQKMLDETKKIYDSLLELK